MLETLHTPPLLYAGALLLGLLIGSFLNVVIHRVPARLEYEWQSQCRELIEGETDEGNTPPPGIVFEPSACPHCGHRIRPWENIPVLSYLLLRGRCSACHAPISIRYPLVETLTALAFVAVIWKFGATAQGLAGLVFTAFLIALSFIDFDHQLLPDTLTFPLLWAGLLLSVPGLFTDPTASIIGATIGYGLLWLVYHVFRLLTGKEGMGYGDFKLMGALGAWLGWSALPLVLLLSSAVGAIAGVSVALIRRSSFREPLPFGPFIAVAGWFSLIWGENALSRYTALFTG